MYRTAIIGAGAAAQMLHLPFLREMTDVKMTAVCRRDGEALQAIADDIAKETNTETFVL